MEINIDTYDSWSCRRIWKIPTTEDTRSGIDRPRLEAKHFQLNDNCGNIIAEDQCSQEDRRNLYVDIDDIYEYTQKTLIKSAEYIP